MMQVSVLLPVVYYQLKKGELLVQGEMGTEEQQRGMYKKKTQKTQISSQNHK